MKKTWEVMIPKESANDDSVYIAKLYFHTGDKVNLDETILDVEYSKLTVSIKTEHEGYIQYLFGEGDIIDISDVVAIIHSNIDGHNDVELEPATKINPLFSKAAIKIIQQRELKKELFSTHDLVSESDVKRAIGLNEKNAVVESCEYEIKEFPNKKRVEQNNIMTNGVISTVYIHIEIENIAPNISCSHTRLLALIISNVYLLLKKHRKINSFYLDGKIAYYKIIKVGMAVDLGEGLKVIYLPEVENHNINRVENQILIAVRNTMKNTLTQFDVQKCTFLISDLGNENVAFFSPIVMKQQCATLSVPAIDRKNGRITLGLSFDHRVINGREACLFLQDLKKLIETI